jgi:glycosyltransferase involved in cell wall biosynthesis
MVARAHAAAATQLGLVMLGNATFDPKLETDVRAAAAPNAVLPGPVFGDSYRSLQANARCYVHATEVGGTHPALIEAMGAGNVCLVLDTPENREVAGPEAWYFADQDGLVDLLHRVDRLDGGEIDVIRQASRNRAAIMFSWERVGASYLELLSGPTG